MFDRAQSSQFTTDREAGLESQVSQQIHAQFQEELMRMNRFGKSVAVAAGFVLMCAASALDRAQSAPTGPGQNQNAASHGAQSNRDPPPANDFAGLDYTPDQKAEIDKIHQETESHKAVIAKDDEITVDQKNAMLLGYTRMEYSLIYRVLTPELQSSR